MLGGKPEAQQALFYLVNALVAAEDSIDFVNFKDIKGPKATTPIAALMREVDPADFMSDSFTLKNHHAINSLNEVIIYGLNQLKSYEKEKRSLWSMQTIDIIHEDLSNFFRDLLEFYIH